MNKLLHEIALRCPDQKLPNRYLVCDLETTGFSPKDNDILQYGFCKVEDRKVIDVFSIIVNHGPAFVIPPGATAVHGIDAVRMAKDGVSKSELTPLIFDLFKSWDGMFVGHNMINFDAPFIEAELFKSGFEFKFEPNRIVDTGMLVKAARLGMYFGPADTLRSFSKRVSEVRAAGIKWSLDHYCFDHYGLEKRAGVNRSQAHDAGIDCLLTHHLLEGLREHG